MVSNNLNSSLINSMHRHPQILNKTAYFVGDGDSSNTFLRWMGTTWENVHKQYAANGYADLLEEHKPWNREYLPVCLANGAAGRFSLWKWYPRAADTIAGGFNVQQGNVPRYITDVLNDDVGYSVYGASAGKLITTSHGEFYDFEPSNPASITGSNVSRNDQAAGIGNKYYWPDGEYRSTIFTDYEHPNGMGEGLENLLGGIIWPIGETPGITVDMTCMLNEPGEQPAYWGPSDDAAEDIEQVWNYERFVDYLNGNDGYPFWFERHMIRTGEENITGHPNSVVFYTWPGDVAGAPDRDIIIAALGYDVDNLQDNDTIKMVVQPPFPAPQKTYTAKISDALDHNNRFGWNWDHFSPNLPHTLDEWTTGPLNNPIWGDNPQITFKFNHNITGIDGETYDNYTPQMEKTLRTPTRTVLLYDLNSIIPAGSPIKKAELHLTSRGRWNWPTAVADTPNYGMDEDNIYSNVHDGVWDSHEDGLENGSSAGATISRNHKIRHGEDYQLTMLHPATTKHATWKTYDGMNPWSELTGATTAYLPHVMSYGNGNDWNRAWPKDGGQFGLGWAAGDTHLGASSDWDARGDYVDCEIHDSRKKWFCFHGNPSGVADNPAIYEHPNYLDAILSPSPEEIKGISGGGVLVRLSTDQNDSTALGAWGNGTSIWTQGQIFDLTKRRYADTIDFKFNHEYENQDWDSPGGLSAGANESTTTIDITKFVEHAMQNEGGKLRMSLTGKFFNGAPPLGSTTKWQNQDSFKTEASWSHNAYYGGESAGRHDPGGGNDWTLPRYLAGITHPYYGEHTIKTELYSMNDDELKLQVPKIKFSDTAEELSETVFDLDELIKSFKTLTDLIDAEGESWGGSPVINDNVHMTIEEDAQEYNFFTIQCLLFKNTGWNTTIMDAWNDMTNAWTNIKAQADNLTNDTPIQIKAGQAFGGDVSPYNVTMGSTDINGGVGQRHGFVLKEVDAAVTTTDNLILGTLTLSVYSPNDNDQSDWLLRKTSNGEPWLINDDAGTAVFNNYFVGEYATNDSTFPQNTALIDEHSFKIVDLPNTPSDGSRQYFIGFPGNPIAIDYLKAVGDIGSLLGITHSIPDGITHDNRGVYRIVDFTNNDTIEVNQIITNQGTIVAGNGYGIADEDGKIPITVLDRRPYLEVTYSEQEDAGV